jgi:PAT family beta-lactamase induction signal transducer AmpG
LSGMMLLFSYFDPQQHLMMISMIGLMVAFVSASQDIVIDAYRTEYLKSYERGIGAASFTFAYRLAMLVSGGVGLIFADKMGWHAFFTLMAVGMLSGALVTLLLPNTREVYDAPQKFTQVFINPFKQFFTRERVIIILLFIVLYKIGEAFTLSLSTAFFLNELHMSLAKIGVMYKVGGFIAAMLGAYMAGLMLPYLGLFRSLLYFGLLQTISSFLFVVLSVVGMNESLVALTICLDLASSGMATTALLAYFMSLCDLRFTGAQFALLTAVMSVGRIFSGPLAGYIVEHTNWTWMFLTGFILSLPALLLIRYLPRVHSVE